MKIHSLIFLIHPLVALTKNRISMRLISFILLLVIATFTLTAQEQIGLRTGNFSGINAVTLNPAASVSYPLLWDLNLGAAGLFVETNYLYLENTSTTQLLRKIENLNVIYRGDVTTETNTNPPNYILDFFNREGKSNYFVNAFATGPSAMVRLGSNHTIGFMSNVRVEASSTQIPEPLNFYQYLALPDFEPFNIQAFHMALMSWRELGLNYAYRFDTDDGYLSIGANVKYLTGYEAAYFQNSNTIQYTKLRADTVESNRALLNYGYTTSSFNENGFNISPNGTGVGIDIGASMTFGGYSDEGYTLKLGASILDLGQITFRGNDVQRHQLNSDSIVSITGDTYTNDINNLNDLVNRFSQETLNDSSATFVARNMAIGLPTGFSLQADYAITDFLFVNALLVQRMPINNISLKRDNILAITPRLEHRWGALHLPMVLHDYKEFRMGLSVRLAYLVVGTDNLFSFFNQNTYSGTDLYVGVKVNPFNFYRPNEKGFKRAKPGKGKVRCYDF